MTIYLLRFVVQSSGEIKTLAFETRELADRYGNRAILAGDIPAFTIQSLFVATEVD